MLPNQQQGRQRTAGGRAVRTENGVPGACSCSGFPPLDDLADLSIQRLLKRLEDELEAYQDTPSEATKKLEDDLKALTKEYSGLTDLVTKYEAFYEKIDCLLADANRWNENLQEWCSKNVDSDTLKEIVRIWNEFYETVENEACTRWISARTEVGSQLDCVRQAERTADEAKDDYEALKAFEKTVKDRYAQLLALYKQGETLNEAAQYNSVCAVSIEFCAAYNELGVLETWERKRRCGAPPQTTEQSGGQGQPGQQEQRGERREGYGGPGSPCDATPEQDPKTYWTVEQYTRELTARLRALILARYAYFRWWQQRIDLEIDGRRSKEVLDKFQKSRQADFIREAGDAYIKRSVVNA
jgi:hypothetical protein